MSSGSSVFMPRSLGRHASRCEMRRGQTIAVSVLSIVAIHAATPCLAQDNRPPKEIFESLGQTFGSIAGSLKSGNIPNQLVDFGIHLPTGIPDREPVADVTNLEKNDVDISDVELNFGRSIVSAEFVRKFCEQTTRTAWAKTPPIVITDRAIQFDLSLEQACSSGNILKGDAKPLIYAVPIAIKAPVIVSPDRKVLPGWISPIHIAAAALRFQFQGAKFGLPTGDVCVPTAAQPTPEELQQALKQAVCILVDELGRRKTGFYPTRDPRKEHFVRSEQDFRAFPSYPFLNTGDQLSDWSKVDYGLRGGQFVFVWQMPRCTLTKRALNLSIAYA